MSRKAKSLRLSTRNLIAGKVTQVQKGIITAMVKVEVSTPSVVTAVITKEACEELGIKEGDNVWALIKATSVSIAKE
jgi:molybdopterin-binding protein